MKSIETDGRFGRFYILDDDDFFLKLFEKQIRKYFPNVEVRLCSTEKELMEELNVKPDLVILDYNLGYDNGTPVRAHSILNKIQDVYSDQKVIFMSANTSSELLHEYSRYRGIEFILKEENAMKHLSSIINQLIPELAI